MFVRKKPNPSGSVSVQVIDKSGGYRVVKTMGTARDPQDVQRLVELGRLFIVRQSGQFSLFPSDERDNAAILDFIQGLGNASIRTVGPELIFGRLFDEIGFGVILEPLFRDIVLARLVYPTSKLKTADYLFRYRGRPVVVADAAMLSQENLDALDGEQYPFIVAARMRNEAQVVQRKILQRCAGLRDGQCIETPHGQNRRLIVAYSDKRAAKDAHNRQRGLAKLRKQVRCGQLTKEHLNNRGYSKFLKLTGEVLVEIDESKVEQAARWDGLKGCLTNTALSSGAVIENYGHLWQVEKAFRISKTDLRIRPMYHRRRRRIEAHVLVAFVAYTIYKELERRLHLASVPISPQRAAELTQTMYEMTFRLPNDPQERRTLLQMDEEQRRLYDLFT